MASSSSPIAVVRGHISTSAFPPIQHSWAVEKRCLSVDQRVEELPARTTYEFNHSLKDLFEFNKGGDIPPESLLRQGYAVRVDYNVPCDKVKQLSNEHSDLWTGRIQSGEVGLLGRLVKTATVTAGVGGQPAHPRIV